MERPNKNELVPKSNFQGTRKRYTKDEYISALEKYCDYLEQLVKNSCLDDVSFCCSQEMQGKEKCNTLCSGCKEYYNEDLR